MTFLNIIVILSLLAIIAVVVIGVREYRARDMQHWWGAYLSPNTCSGRLSTRLTDDEPVHVFIAVCDHYEPEFGRPSKDVSIARVDRWVNDYPERFGEFRDFDGRPPQHTYFFPQDEYAPEYLDRLAEVCAAGFGDVEVHLHHDGDTPESLREKLEEFKETLHHKHGLLRRDPETGEIVYGFIHGNWALCNSRLDGRWCGVDQELTVLLETGCYADFTMPSAPSETQTSTMNSIYYAQDKYGRNKSHDTGIRATVGRTSPESHLLMIQGPLLFDWSSRKFGVIPRIENGDIHHGMSANWDRMQAWLKAGVHVAGRPNWKFVKLFTHGCNERNLETMLGPEMLAFHAELARQAELDRRFRYHYVTAWEMAQLVHQAEANEPEPILVSRSAPQPAT
ncbi:MAG: hypothetical protein KDA93_15330 [Planctomycetaceae bacterium]|nr:hypothetical protein [Planctomycetaceae bacterium]